MSRCRVGWLKARSSNACLRSLLVVAVMKATAAVAAPTLKQGRLDGTQTGVEQFARRLVSAAPLSRGTCDFAVPVKALVHGNCVRPHNFSQNARLLL